MKTIKLFSYLFILLYCILGNDLRAQIKCDFIESIIRSGGSVSSNSTVRLTNNGLLYKITWQNSALEIDSTRYYFIPIAYLDSTLMSRYKKTLNTYEKIVSENNVIIDYKNSLDRYNPGAIKRIIFFDLETNLITTQLVFYMQNPLLEFYYILINMIGNKVHRDKIERIFFSEHNLKLLKTIYLN